MSEEKELNVSKRQDWLFDTIVGFLKSERWSKPIQNFMDNNCHIFTKDSTNSLNHTSVHKQFQSLIEGILEGFLSDIGVNEEEFVECCSMGSMKNEFMKVVVDYILAMDDFSIFKKMMEKRNVDLQMKILSQMDSYITPNTIKPNENEMKKNLVGDSHKLDNSAIIPEEKEETKEKIINYRVTPQEKKDDDVPIINTIQEPKDEKEKTDNNSSLSTKEMMEKYYVEIKTKIDSEKKKEEPQHHENENENKEEKEEEEKKKEEEKKIESPKKRIIEYVRLDYEPPKEKKKKNPKKLKPMKKKKDGENSSSIRNLLRAKVKLRKKRNKKRKKGEDVERKKQESDQNLSFSNIEIKENIEKNL